MDFQQHILETSLRPGDIVIMENKTHRFLQNIAVVTQANRQEQDCRVALWRNTHYPYTLTETTLPSGEALREDNLVLHVFRLKDQDLAQRAVTLLKNWCLWAVPFDAVRFRQAEEYNNNIFGVDADFLNDKIPNMFNCPLFHINMQKNCDFLHQKFRENYLDIVKYAARREISPVRPTLEKEEKKTGFHFAQGILIAFQVASVQHFVKPENKTWLSNKEAPSLKSIKKTLKSNFDENAFLNSIPFAFQLWAKLASIETFHTFLRDDYENILSMGTFVPTSSEKSYAFNNREYENITFAYQVGLLNRAALINEVIEPSSKPKSDSLKDKLYKKCSQYF